jgi:hypothetical protein
LVSSTFILGRPGKSGNTGIALTYYIYPEKSENTSQSKRNEKTLHKNHNNKVNAIFDICIFMKTLSNKAQVK